MLFRSARRSPETSGDRYVIELVGVSSVRTLHFSIERGLMLETPDGVRQLTRFRSEDGDGGGTGSLEIWLTEDGDLMPYRIRLEDQRGQVLDQVLAGG